MKKNKHTQTCTFKIYVKGKKSPLAIFSLPDDSFFNDLYTMLNSKENYIKIGQLILNKDNFDYATLEY